MPTPTGAVRGGSKGGAAGRDERAWWERVPETLRYPVGSLGAALGCGLLGVLAWIGVAVGRFGMLSFTGTGVIVGLIFSTVFLVIRSSANGGTEMPEIGNVANVRDEVIVPGLKATALAAVLLLPMGAILARDAFAGAPEKVRAAAGGLGAIAGGVGDGKIDPDQMAAALKAFGVAAGGGETAPAASVGTGEELSAAAREARNADAASAERDAEEAAAGGKGARAVGAAAHFAALAFTGTAAAALFPLCLLVLALSRSLLSALNPGVLSQILGRVFVPYLGLLAGGAVLAALAAVLSWPLGLIPVPLLPSLGARIVQVYALLCFAHMLGWFVWQHREALGYVPDVQEAMTAERVRAIKRATLAEVARGGGPAARAAAAQLAAMSMDAAPAGAVVGARAGSGAVAAVSPPAAPAASAYLAPPDADEVTGLRARFHAACAARDLAAAAASAPLLADVAWQAGDPAAAIALYAQLAALDPGYSFDAARQARLARSIEETGDALAAAGAWHALAAAHPKHASAARALYRCGDCFARAGRPADARAAFEAILARHPADESAALAKSRLRAL